MKFFKNNIAELTGTLQPAKGELVLELRSGWPDKAPAVAWNWTNEGRNESGVAEDLAGLPAHVKEGGVHAWTPGENTLALEVSLPTRSRSKLRQAIPFAVEDHMLEPPEDLHYAFDVVSDNRAAVAVTRAELIRAWQKKFAEKGLRVTSMSPSYLQIPFFPKAWTLRLREDWLDVRTGRTAGFSVPANSAGAPRALKIALAEAASGEAGPASLILYGAIDGALKDRWESDLNATLQTARAETPTMERPLNLLEKKSDWPVPTGRWIEAYKPALAVLLIWFISSSLMNAVDWVRLGVVEKKQRAAMTALFKQSFPQAKTIIDPALQMERNFVSMGAEGGPLSDGDFLPLLALATANLKNSPDVRVETLQYEDRALTLGLAAADFKSLDAAEKSFQSAGLKTQTISADRKDGRVKGRIRISAGSL